jgi:Ca2+-binding RTX toxin-like protein
MRLGVATALAVPSVLLPATALPAATANAAPEGAGFTLNAGDLRFILKQIKIAEAHATTEDGPGQPLVGDGPNQIPSPLLPFGLRAVDGSENNLQPGQDTYGAAHQVFPRLTAPVFRAADGSTVPGVGPVGPPGQTSYTQKSGAVVDAEPRMVSNLIVDQTSSNPAAVQAAGVPHRSFNSDPTAVPCTAPDTPAGCTPDGKTLFIPNVTTDVGLSPPFNSWFTLFGQFFDHGVDFTVKGGSGTVFMPLPADDPLIAGPDRQVGTADDLPADKRFMVLTRAKNQPGLDGVLGTADDVQDATNTDSPWVDQSQTYTSHPAHQVFLRAYENDTAGNPVSTGKLIQGADGGMATWADVKSQARTLLGIELVDADVLSVPMLATDQYGRFLRGPDGLPQIVTSSGLVEGDTSAPVAVPTDAVRTGVAFLDDIAHHAVPAAGLAPDADATASNDFAAQPAGTYDDEMLDAHFVAGDGRVNENIGLTAVHQIFHSEHNRLVDYVKNLIVDQNIDVSEWQLSPDVWDGERLFQAARFVTEMEYQHLVFEEFARKIQPGLDPFSPIQTDVNAAINAEFAHAVYRFGHSMLTDTIARTNADGSPNDIPLLDGFLNPLAYNDGGPSGRLTPEQAAGSIAMGMTDQTGNEIDEFVTETLRNNLLGLPLDLATINMTRARDAGVPPLNVFRRQMYADTHDASLKPYTSWVDFGLHLKHQYSLVNFMAAYGTHPSIANATTLADRREAARLIYENDPVLNPATPADARDFLNSTGAWADNAAGASTTGLDEVDLWVGGLAESQNLFGGLLGSTFNYVFEQQLAKLQNGDRLYYLARTAGLNLLTQLESNSFAELVMRNTDARALKADVFGTADCEFELANLDGTPAGYAASGNTVADDAATECDESLVLARMPDGTIRYRQSNTVDPSGINAQSTYNGTAGDDRAWGGVDNDTFWGNEGADRFEGDDGSDTALGGVGDDIITDTAGDDVHKGGHGDDAIDAGPGLDIVMGGFGSDFTLGGFNTNETFAGEGDDFVNAGTGADTAFGDGGDDWLEGGDQADLLQGDNGAPFFDDNNAPGDDVFFGQGGDDDYDAEGGDDIMVAGPGIERNAGVRGFDWVTHAGDPQPANADLNRLIIALPPPLQEVRDRFAETEALSGWKFDDVLRGDDIVPADVVIPDAAPESDVLTAEGIDAIAGLRGILPAGTTRFGAGNIILGGAGSDVIEGRGADDIIDGDAWLNVRLSVRTDPADPATEVRSATSMAELQDDVFAGRLDPGNIVVVREIVSDPNPDDIDTAVFSDIRANYDVTTVGGVTTVAHAVTAPVGGGGGIRPEGTDVLTNVERLVFADTVVPSAPLIGLATGGNASATVNWTVNGTDTATQFQVRVVDATGNQVGALRPAPAGARALGVTGLVNGQSYRFQVRAVNGVGAGAFSAQSNAVTPQATVPAAPTLAAPVAGDRQVALSWTGPPDGGSPLTGFRVRVIDEAGGETVRTVNAGSTSLVVSGLTNGSTYWFSVAATNALGVGPESPLSTGVVPATLPAAPSIGSATGGNASALVRWSPPVDTGGLAVSGYRVRVVDAAGNQVGALRNANAAARTLTVTGLTNGSRYRFRVAAVTPMGTGPMSALSNAVTPATVPGVPVVGTASSGAAGGQLTATARWSPPASNGGSPVTAYVVTALRMSSSAPGARVLARLSSPALAASARSRVLVLPAGVYRFHVVARNAVGTSPPSARSNAVSAR